ncbi:hypothetical protein CF319_g6358 [Tilletia indica]|nr:hypothetical protein CF319_g6358 [Tilletia indica]
MDGKTKEEDEEAAAQLVSAARNTVGSARRTRRVSSASPHSTPPSAIKTVGSLNQDPWTIEQAPRAIAAASTAIGPRSTQDARVLADSSPRVRSGRWLHRSAIERDARSRTQHCSAGSKLPSVSTLAHSILADMEAALPLQEEQTAYARAWRASHSRGVRRTDARFPSTLADLTLKRRKAYGREVPVHFGGPPPQERNTDRTHHRWTPLQDSRGERQHPVHPQRKADRTIMELGKSRTLAHSRPARRSRARAACCIRTHGRQGHDRALAARQPTTIESSTIVGCKDDAGAGR